MKEPLQQQFIIKTDSLFLQVGLVATVMECIGLYFFIPLLSEAGGTLLDCLARAVLCLWLLVALLGAIVSFYCYSKRIMIHNDGISYRSLFTQKHFAWSEIQDFGLSYEGKSKVGIDIKNTYQFYFATQKQKNRSQYKQRLSAKAVKVQIIGEEYSFIVQEVIPFCSSKTSVKPFIPPDDFHLV